LLPAADSEDGTPVIENLHRWLDKGLWGLGQRTGYRKSFAPGDRLCFYAARTGVVLECVAASAAFDLRRKDNPSTVEVPYGIRVEQVNWLDAPIELTAKVRGQLSAFQGRDLSKGWAWFVQGTSKLTDDDFRLLTGQTTVSGSKAVSATTKRRGPPSKLVPINEDYGGKKARAIVFQRKRYGASTWKDATLCLFELLRRRDSHAFEETALTLVGRKRPYVSRDKSALRIPQLIPNTTSIYLETNLSANYMVKLCYTLLDRLGYSRDDLAFEVEP
jgi:hypothetical protein